MTKRRTVLAGAAWSVPVIAAAIAAPLAAASTVPPTPVPTLTFVNGPFTVAGCTTFAPIVRETTDGTTPAAGRPITITPPAGFTWANGTSTARTVITDVNGRATFPAITAPFRIANGSWTALATDGTLRATRAITVTPAARAILGATMAVMQGGSPTVIQNNVPLNIRRMEVAENNAGGSVRMLLTEGNLLYINNAGAQTNIIDADAAVVNGIAGIYLLRASGQVDFYNPNSQTFHVQATGIPTTLSRFEAADNNAGQSTWMALTPNGSLFVDGELNQRGVVYADTGVVDGAAGVYYLLSNGDVFFYNSVTKIRQLQASGIPTSLIRFEASDSSAGAGAWLALTANGTLYINGVIRARGVVDADSYIGLGVTGVSFLTNAGEIRTYNIRTDTIATPSTGQPTTGVIGYEAAENGESFSTVGTLYSNGNLYVNGIFKDSNVISMDTGVSNGNVPVVYYVKRYTTC